MAALHRLNTPMNPNIDEAISAFLATKGIECEPFQAQGRGMAVAVTMINPLLGAAQYAMNNQKNGAAKAEWTQWKMWTLDHAEWPAFFEQWKKEQQEAFDKLEADRQEELRLLEEERREAAEEMKRQMMEARRKAEERARAVTLWWKDNISSKSSAEHGKNILVMSCAIVVFSIGSIACVGMLGGLTADSDRQEQVRY